MAVCTGCNKDSNNLSEYDKENPVENDGSYANGKFVCTYCYCKLIDIGYDVGEPEVLQRRASKFIRSIRDRTLEE